MPHSFTPGPWTFQPCDEYTNCFDVLCEKDYYVATTHDGVRGDRNADANARLIAAAPTMYEFIASSASNGCAEARKIMEAINAGR